MTPPPDAAVAALAEALAFVPEPFEIRRGVSAGGEPVWGPPEPGSYTVQQRAESVLAMLQAAGWTLSHDSERECPSPATEAERQGGEG